MSIWRLTQLRIRAIPQSSGPPLELASVACCRVRRAHRDAPDFVHQWVFEVVIASDEKIFICISSMNPGNSFHWVSITSRSSSYPSIRSPNGHDERRPQEIEESHGRHPDPRSMAASVIGHDGDIETHRIVEDRLVGPRFASVEYRQHECPG